MQIQSQTQAADPTQIANAASSASQTPGSVTNIDGLANENTFLQLLVAQIKNQDPLQPADSIQFLSQLAQFSQLEQLIGIRQELQPPASQNGSGTPSTTNNATGASPTTNNATGNPAGGTTDTTGTTN